MQLIALEVCGGIALLVFGIMLGAIAHRAQRSYPGTHHRLANGEYSWAIIPWLMIAGASLPAVRLIVTGSEDMREARSTMRALPSLQPNGTPFGPIEKHRADAP